MKVLQFLSKRVVKFVDDYFALHVQLLWDLVVTGKNFKDPSLFNIAPKFGFLSRRKVFPAHFISTVDIKFTSVIIFVVAMLIHDQNKPVFTMFQPR